MPISLKPHNLKPYKQMKGKMKESKRGAIIHPTGTGKMFIGLKTLEDNKEKRALYLAPSNAILHDVKKNIFAEGMTMSDFPNLKRMTYQKLMTLTDEEIEKLEVDIIILDEFHHCGAPEWGKGVKRLLKRNKDAFVMGFSATPLRYSDGLRDMADELFQDDVVSEMSLEEAIEKGILPQATYISALYGYDKEELENIQESVNQIKNEEKKKKAQILLKRAKEILDKNTKNLPELFSKHMKNQNGKYIVFCKNIEEMNEKVKQAQEMFGKVNKNIKVRAVSSKIKNTDKILTEFEQDNSEDELKLLFAVDMINEGYHVKGLDGVIMMRPTSSPAIFSQQLGRGLSVGEEKNPVILDLVNNYTSCKIIEDFAKRIREEKKIGGENEENKENEENEKSGRGFIIYDETKEYREIVERITELTSRKSIDDKIDALVEWRKKYPKAMITGSGKIDYIENLREYAKNEKEYQQMCEEYKEMQKYCVYVKKNKSKNKLTKTQVEKCKKADIGGILGYSIEVENLAKKYGIQEKEALNIIVCYGSMENFYKLHREGTLDEKDEIFARTIIKDAIDMDGTNNPGMEKLITELLAEAEKNRKVDEKNGIILYSSKQFINELDGLNEKDRKIIEKTYNLTGEGLTKSMREIKEELGLDGAYIYRKQIGIKRILRINIEKLAIRLNQLKFELLENKKLYTENEIMEFEKEEKVLKDISMSIVDINSNEAKESLKFFRKFDEEYPKRKEKVSKNYEFEEGDIDPETIEHMKSIGMKSVSELSDYTEYDLRKKGFTEVEAKKITTKLDEYNLRTKKAIFLEQGIEELGLSSRTYNALKRKGISKLQELCNLTIEDLSKIRDFGKFGKKEVIDGLASQGIQLKSEESKEELKIDEQLINEKEGLKEIILAKQKRICKQIYEKNKLKNLQRK